MILNTKVFTVVIKNLFKNKTEFWPMICDGTCTISVTMQTFKPALEVVYTIMSYVTMYIHRLYNWKKTKIKNDPAFVDAPYSLKMISLCRRAIQPISKSNCH